MLKTPPCKNKWSETLTGGMIPLETKQSRGKLLHHSDLRGGEGGVFLGESSRNIQRGMKIGTWNIRKKKKKKKKKKNKRRGRKRGEGEREKEEDDDGCCGGGGGGGGDDDDAADDDYESGGGGGGSGSDD